MNQTSVLISSLTEVEAALYRKQDKEPSREVSIALINLQTAILWLQKSNFIVNEVSK